jgi:hypothetical protein
VRVRRCSVRDEYTEDGVSVVLVEENVMVLSALATDLLHRISSSGTDLEVIAAGLVDTFGPPPGPDDGLVATRSAVQELVDYGIVEWTT